MCKFIAVETSFNTRLGFIELVRCLCTSELNKLSVANEISRSIEGGIWCNDFAGDQLI